jgi:hypothetical protein
MWGLIGALGEAGFVRGENLVQGPGIEQPVSPSFQGVGIGVIYAGGHFSGQGAKAERQLPDKQTCLA